MCNALGKLVMLPRPLHFLPGRAPVLTCPSSRSEQSGVGEIVHPQGIVSDTPGWVAMG